MGREKIAPRSVAEDALRTLGAQIRAARVRQTWTQKRLAAVIHVSERTVSLIERGDPSVSVGNVFNAAVATGVPLFQEASPEGLSKTRQRFEEISALIPQRVAEVKEVPDALRDF